MKRVDELPQPLNAQERFLHAIAVRQNILIEQMNSVVEYIAKEKNVATTNHKAVESVSVAKPVEKPAPKRATTTTRKRTATAKKEDAVGKKETTKKEACKKE